MTAKNSVYENPNVVLSREVDVGFGVGFTALHLSSAAYGFSKTSACRELHSNVGVGSYVPPPKSDTGKTTPHQVGTVDGVPLSDAELSRDSVPATSTAPTPHLTTAP